ncbi:tetratricopeptide repeat protein [Aquabacterium sp.]|uniref:tetratricopeptide repeat protein n=1 Tax=Aquabacterium sp. TaxID=1872578 RepID=UPI003784D6DD
MPAHADDEPPSPALVQAELDRIAASDTFARSARHVRFLRYLVEATQAGRSAALREKAIAVAVMLRDGARFDPRADSIVRVEARRLRAKLAAYYADEGLDARLEFRIPTRSFRVEVLRRRLDPATRPRASVAVFDLVAEDAALAPAARLATADLADWLVRLNGLRVVRAGVAPDGEAARRQAARRLGTACLLHGSLAGSPPRLELALQRAEDTALLWSRHQPWETGADALLPLAKSLVAELHREAAGRRLQRIGPAAALRTRAAPAGAALRDPMALARIALLSHNAEGTAKAVALMHEAVELDATHAPAQALLAEALLAQAMLTAVPSRPALEGARAAAERALELDPDCASAHGVLAMIRFQVDRDWPRAEARLLAALRCAPGLAPSHARYGWALMMNRRFAEARAAYLEARELDPTSVQYRSHEALISIYERDWPSAAAALDAVLDVAPGDLVALALRAALCLYAGELDAGRDRYRALQERWPRLSIGLCGLAQALALAGQEAAAREHLAALQAMARETWVSPYQLAMVHTRLGERPAALAELERSAALADGNFVCVAVDPAFDALRPDPAYGALLRRHGFAHLA